MAKVETHYHALVGKKKIRVICREGGITPKDELIIDQMLLGLHLEGGDYENIRHEVEVRLRFNPRANLIKEVFFSILHEVEREIIKRWEKKGKGEE